MIFCRHWINYKNKYSEQPVKQNKDTPVPLSAVTNYPNPLDPFGADPGVILANRTYCCYFTSGNSTGAMPIKWSSDLFIWTALFGW
ncbi:MAG: hypothetical protein M3352_09125 [Bacteroidota bacterium]|nr:hypothetical protein [Bacteroidota bacterium]